MIRWMYDIYSEDNNFLRWQTLNVTANPYPNPNPHTTLSQKPNKNLRSYTLSLEISSQEQLLPEQMSDHRFGSSKSTPPPPPPSRIRGYLCSLPITGHLTPTPFSGICNHLFVYNKNPLSQVFSTPKTVSPVPRKWEPAPYSYIRVYMGGGGGARNTMTLANARL